MIGRLQVVATPKDTISVVGSRVVLECSVISMSANDIVTWWYYDGRTYEQLFVSNTGESGTSLITNTDNYNIPGQFNLIIQSARFENSGIYVCDISNHRNYSADLPVLGMSDTLPLHNCGMSSKKHVLTDRGHFKPVGVISDADNSCITPWSAALNRPKLANTDEVNF